MADEKAAPPPKDPPKDPFVDIVWTLAALFLVFYLLNGVYSTITRSRIFSNGLRGLTPQGMLLLNTRPISSLYNAIGAKVVSIQKTDVLNSPGGRKVGEQKMSARGVILQGPVTIDDVRYWYVDYETEPDGWVKEDDIAYVEREPNIFQKAIIYIYDLVWYIKLLAILIFALSVVGIFYLNREINKFRANEDKLLYPELNKPELNENPQWQNVLDHLESVSENDWRLCILEADIMLDDLLDKLGLPGETMGDKLKAVDRSDFTTIDNAWEAHKVRNQIAHEGQAFVLTQREARRIIDLYRSVFEEFQII